MTLHFVKHVADARAGAAVAAAGAQNRPAAGTWARYRALEVWLRPQARLAACRSPITVSTTSCNVTRHTQSTHPRPHSSTTGILKFAECFYVSRVYSLGHSANKLFAECCAKNTRQREGLPSVKKKNTRQRGCLPSIFFFALGKEIKSFSEKEGEEKNKKKLCRVPRSRTLGKG